MTELQSKPHISDRHVHIILISEKKTRYKYFSTFKQVLSIILFIFSIFCKIIYLITDKKTCYVFKYVNSIIKRMFNTKSLYIGCKNAR